MDNKVCTKCLKKLPATREYFHIQARGKYGLRSKCIDCTRAYSKSRQVLVPKKTEKACGRCKETFPLTSEYFYTKTTKKGTIIKGKPLSVDSISFRSICKKCNGKSSYDRKLKKIMQENNLSNQEELQIFLKSRIKIGHVKRRKYEYPEGLTANERLRYKRIKDLGYNPDTYSADWKKEWYLKNRKHIYPEFNLLVPKTVQNKRISDQMPDSFIANRLGFKLEEVPQDLIELKRKQLKFYRHVKENNNQKSDN